MRDGGAEAVDVGDVCVRFEKLECEREHAAYDEPSEEEWQRRHEWVDTFDDRNLHEAKERLAEADEYRDELVAKNRQVFELMEKLRVMGEQSQPQAQDTAPTLTNPVPEAEPEADGFSTWFTKDPHPPHFNR